MSFPLGLGAQHKFYFVLHRLFLWRVHNRKNNIVKYKRIHPAL